MKPRSPTLEGFRLILHQPSFGLAEIAWRWSFGAATTLLLIFSFFEYLDTLPVSNSDLLLLRTRQPVLISRAALHIFRGSAFRVVETAALLLVALGAAWIVIVSLGRATTLKALLNYFRESGISSSDDRGKSWRWRSLFALNFFRLASTLAAMVGCIAAILLGSAVSRPNDPAPGSVLLIILTVTMLAWLAWSTVNWFLSLAAICVVADGQDTFGAIAAAVDLCQTRPGSFFAAGTWFGLAHITAFVIASSAVAFPLGFAAVLPTVAVLGGVLLITMLYFGITDFLYLGRLAAYLAIAEMPEPPVNAEPTQPQLPQVSTPSTRTVDATELILSDVPTSS